MHLIITLLSKLGRGKVRFGGKSGVEVWCLRLNSRYSIDSLAKGNCPFNKLGGLIGKGPYGI